MKILNVGCGGTRPKSLEWSNLDDLHPQLPEGTPARIALDGEPNYLNFQLLSEPMPFPDGEFDGILASHLLEHFDAQDGLKLLKDCHRLLKPGGVILISVPNATYFKEVFPMDRNEAWPQLYHVSDPKNPIPTFHQAALWFEQHKVILNDDALWSYLVMAGFHQILRWHDGTVENTGLAALDEMGHHLNRIPFSLVMSARKK